MKILLVKTSSMGDVVHALTAVREAKSYLPDIQFDWLVEESFADIAEIALNNGDINTIIPIRFREWRKQKPFGIFFNPALRQLKKTLQKNDYDLVLDAQGLLKSVFLARLSSAPIYGFDKQSVREKLCSFFYQNSFFVDTKQHAIHRQRQLFAQALNYSIKQLPPSFTALKKLNQDTIKPSVLCFHGTTWDNKQYPTSQWRELASQLASSGYQVLLPHHGNDEFRVATSIADSLDNVIVLPEQPIKAFVTQLQSAHTVISVDTGLAHLATYLGIPTVILFGPTRPELTGGIGEHTINLVGEAPDTGCMKRTSYSDKDIFSESMSAISVDTIISATTRLMSNPP